MKKGFTLIELLAVIVILAIIATIATPMVLNIIENTQNSALLRSAENYLDGVEQAIMKQNVLSVGNFKPGTCDINEDGNLVCDGTNIEVEVKGQKPDDGEITFSDGKIDAVSLIYGDKTIVKNDAGEIVY